VSEALVRLRADSSNYKAGMASAVAATKEFKQETDNSTGSLNRMFSASNLVKGALIGLATSGLARGAIGAFQIAGSFEQTRIALTALYGSAEEAEYRFKQIQDFAATTPFELPDLLTATKRLLVLGYNAEQVLPVMTQLGNAAGALGLSGESINRVVYALGQMKGLGRVVTQDLRQISDAFPGFNPFLAIADSMGVTQQEVRKLIENGLVPADSAIEAILKGLEKIPGALGAMERQSKTLMGLMSTLKDNIRIALDSAIRPFLPQVNGVLTTMINAVGPAFLKVAAGIGVGVKMIQSVLGPMFNGFRNLYTALQPVIQGLGTILVGALMVAFKVLETLAGAFSRVTIFIKDNAVAFQTAAVAALAFYAVIQTGKLIGAIQGFITFLQVLIRFVKIYKVEMFAAAAAQMALAAPIYLIIGAIAALSVALVYAYNTSADFRKGISDAFNYVAKAVGQTINFVLTKLSNFLSGIARVIRTNQSFVDMMQKIFNVFALIVTTAITIVLVQLANLIKGLATVINFFEPFAELLKPVFQAAATVIGAFVYAALKLFQLVAKGVGTLIEVAGEGIRRFIEGVSRLARFIPGLGAMIGNALNEVAGVVSSATQFISNSLTKFADIGIDTIKGFFGSVADNLPKMNKSLIENARGWGNYSDGVAGSLSSAANAILDFAEKAQNIPSIVSNVVPSMANGIADVAERAAAFLLTMGSSIVNFTSDDPFGKLADGASSILEKIKSALGIGKQIEQAVADSEAYVPKTAVDPVVEAAKQSAEDAAKAASMVDKIKEAVKTGVNSVVTLIEEMRKAAKEYADSLKKTIQDFGSIRAVDLPENFIPQAQSLIDNMKMRLNRAREFSKQIQELQRLGLNASTLEDIVSAGPTQGFALASSLIAGGQAAIAQINEVSKALTETGQSLGNFMAGVIYTPQLEQATIALAGLTGRPDVRTQGNQVYVSQGAFVVNIDVSDAASTEEITEMVTTKIEQQFAQLVKELQNI
jgi:tape measure domain-containing protein